MEVLSQAQVLAPALLECFAAWLVLYATFPRLGDIRFGRAALALCCLLHLLALCLPLQALPSAAARQILQTALQLLGWWLYACAACQGRLWQKAAVVAAFFALLHLTLFSVERLEIAAFGMQTLIYFNRKLCLPVAHIVSRCFFLALCTAYAQLQQKRRAAKPLPTPVLAALLALPLVGLGCASVSLLLQLGSRGARSQVTAALCVALLAAEIALVLAAVWARRALALQQQCRLQLQLQEKQRIQTEELRQLFSSQRAQTHEYRNRLTVLSLLLAQQQYAQASDFLRQLTDCTYCDSPTVQTNHPIVDAVLNLKYAQARAQQTAMRFTVGDLSALPFTDDELVKLLGNLLDNALEACRKLDARREIDFKLLCQDGGVVFSVRNPLPPKEQAARQDELLHGFGLQTVDRVLQHHQIPYAITREYGWFQFTAIGWPQEAPGGREA